MILNANGFNIRPVLLKSCFWPGSTGGIKAAPRPKLQQKKSLALIVTFFGVTSFLSLTRFLGLLVCLINWLGFGLPKGSKECNPVCVFYADAYFLAAYQVRVHLPA